MINYRLDQKPPFSSRIALEILQAERNARSSRRNGCLYLATSFPLCLLLFWLASNGSAPRPGLFLLICAFPAFLAGLRVAGFLSGLTQGTHSYATGYLASAMACGLVAAYLAVQPDTANLTAALLQVCVHFVYWRMALRLDTSLAQLERQAAHLEWLSPQDQQRCEHLLRICRQYPACDRYRVAVSQAGRLLTVGEADMIVAWATAEPERERQRRQRHVFSQLRSASTFTAANRDRDFEAMAPAMVFLPLGEGDTASPPHASRDRELNWARRDEPRSPTRGRLPR